MRVMGLDVDGTLVKSWTAELLPGVRDELERLRDAGFQVFVATNQAGPVWRAMTGQTKYPTTDEVVEKLSAIMRHVHAIIPRARWCVATHPGENVPGELAAWEGAAFRVMSEMRPALAQICGADHLFISNGAHFRKPQPGMAERARRIFRCSPAEMLYVGDLASDEEFANNAGILFLHADMWRTGLIWTPDPNDEL